MPNVDQFESVFLAAVKEPYDYAKVVVGRALVVSDLDADSTRELLPRIRRFLSVLGEDVQWRTAAGDDTRGVDRLLALVDREKPDLIITWRNLHAPRSPYTLGSHLDVLTQATPTPVLVIPHPAEDAAARALEDTNVVMAMTDHLAGDDRLVNYAAAFTAPGGTLVLTHVEDERTFDRYMGVIAKIPAIDTDTARQTIQSQLLKEPHDFVRSCAEVIREANLPIHTVEAVTMGGRIAEYNRLIDEHKTDLLVLNTKDADQSAMHGMAYPLAVELRGTPMLML